MDKEISLPEKILIVRTDRIGDVLLSTPVIKNLRLTYPNAYIAFMCRPYTKDVLLGNPYLDEVIIYDKDDTQGGLWASIKFSLFLRSKKFDWALILHPTVRAHIITFFAKIPFRIGFDIKKPWLLSKRIPHTKQEGLKHEMEYSLDILRNIGVPVVDKALFFPIREESERMVRQLLVERGIRDGEEFIVIHPSASCPSKRWPIIYFSQLVKILKHDTLLKIVVITSEKEKDVASGIIAENEVVDLRGKLSVSEVGSLIKRAVLFISCDSGPVHIACALGIPVISIFGRSNPGLSPRRWGPLGDNSFYFHKDVGCNTCLAHNCSKGFACLAAIKPEEVAKKALDILYG